MKWKRETKSKLSFSSAFAHFCFIVSYRMKATLAALVHTKINSVIKQQKERAFGFDRETSPLLQFS